MNDNKILKEIQEVSFQLSDGSLINCEVFLNLHGVHHSGPQNLGDLLNEGEQFIPVKTNGKTLLLNIRHIQYARISSHQEEDDLMKIGIGHTISVNIALGEAIEGDIFISVPRGSGRANEFLNMSSLFIRIFQAEHVVYINQKFIVSVYDEI